MKISGVQSGQERKMKISIELTRHGKSCDTVLSETWIWTRRILIIFKDLEGYPRSVLDPDSLSKWKMYDADTVKYLHSCSLGSQIILLKKCNFLVGKKCVILHLDWENKDDVWNSLYFPFSPILSLSGLIVV